MSEMNMELTFPNYQIIILYDQNPLRIMPMSA